MKLTPRQIGNIKAALNKYVEEEDDPSIQGFCARYSFNGRHFTPKQLNDLEPLRPLIEWASVKEEHYLVSVKKELPMAIFRLKQPKFGYIDNNTKGTEVNITFTNSIPRPKKKIIDQN